MLHILLSEGNSMENILNSMSVQALLHSITVMKNHSYIGKFEAGCFFPFHLFLQGGYINI